MSLECAAGAMPMICSSEKRDRLIVRALKKLSTEDALDRLEKAGIAPARVNDLELVWHHPQIVARRRRTQIDSPCGPLPALIPLSGKRWSPGTGAVPDLGQHTNDIIEEFGLAS